MTVMDFPLASADALDALSVSGPHSIEVGHLDSRPDTARIPLQLSVQLPAHYLVAALLVSSFASADDLPDAVAVREAVAHSLISSTFMEIENTAYAIAAGKVTDASSLAWIEVLRAKVAEAFAPCDPRALPKIKASAPEVTHWSDGEPLATFPASGDPN